MCAFFLGARDLYWGILSVPFGIIFRLYFCSAIKYSLEGHCSINCEKNSLRRQGFSKVYCADKLLLLRC